MTSSYEQAVWAWAAHLRSGGTTPWSEHGTREAPTDVPTRSPVPDAVHLSWSGASTWPPAAARSRGSLTTC